MNFDKYKETVLFLESLYNLKSQKISTQKDIKNIVIKEHNQTLLYFLSLLDNPQNKLKFIHISGTSGKGSTANYCQNILTKSGYKTGLFQSPHITTFIERIKVNSKYISSNEFIKLVEYIKPFLSKLVSQTDFEILSFGEVSFCLALLYFVQKKCAFAVIEVGCGGFSDHTNIIPPPHISIITNIGKDHLNSIGPTLLDIAYEKSGIIKKDSLFLTAEQNPTYIKIFQKQCNLVKADFKKLNFEFKLISATNNLTSFLYKNYNYKIKTTGDHQIKNAILAIEAGLYLNITPKKINKGLLNTTLPCRFEIIDKNPTIIIDGAHNEDKLKSTFDSLTNLIKIKTQQNSKLFIILSLIEGKDLLQTIQSLPNKLDKLILTRHNHIFRKAFLPKKFFDILTKIKPNLNALYFIDPNDALKYTLSIASKNDIILITGSIYMAGILRKNWIPEEQILHKRKSI